MRNAFAHDQIFVDFDSQGNELWKLFDKETHDSKTGKKHPSAKIVMIGSIKPSQFRKLVEYLLNSK